MTRAESDPDFVYLTDQVAMASETQGLTALPLNEKERIALRDAQESQALAIENKRRGALGLPALDSLRDEEDMVTLDEGEQEDEQSPDGSNTQADDTALQAAGEDEDEVEDSDVLLIEAGRILADALALTGGASGATTVTAQR